MWEDDVAIVMPIGEHTHAKHVPRSKSGEAFAKNPLFALTGARRSNRARPCGCQQGR